MLSSIFRPKYLSLAETLFSPSISAAALLSSQSGCHWANKGKNRKFKFSFYPNCLNEWSKLDPEIRLAPSIAIFMKKLISKIRPPAKSVVGIHDPVGLSYLTQLRVGLSKLCFYKFKDNFRGSINPMCPTNDGIETRGHFLLLCRSFEVERLNLLAKVFELIRPYGYIDPSNEALTQLVLYGDKYPPNDLNRNIPS